jgi:hypothetical protein
LHRRSRRFPGGTAPDSGLSLFEDLVEFFLIFKEEIRNVEKSVSLKTDIHKRGLHARQHTADTAFVNPADQPDVCIPFIIHFDQFVVFQHCDLRLVWRR